MTTPADRLGHQLRRHREFAGLTGRKLAAKMGISQSKISRIESGETSPTRPEVYAWAAATGLDRKTRDQLLELAHEAFAEVRSWRDVLRGDKGHLQDDFGDRDRRSKAVRNFQPTVIPGLLQTRIYARRVISVADIAGRFDHEAHTAGRLERQKALGDPGRNFQFIIGEGALYWNPGLSRAQLAEQLDRVAALSKLDTVLVAVLPLASEAVAAPWANFVIHEEDEEAAEYVSVELSHAEVVVTKPEDVALYRTLYERLWSVAAKGADAVEIIQRVAADLREDQ